jgi:TetR/AcrR family fatty acid metabolism transcriptional regulator
VFARQGFYQSTVAQIAREAGVADGTIYLYFKNKDDILVQFFNYRTKQVFDRFRAAVNQSDNSLDKLRSLIRLAEAQIREMSQMYQDLVSEILETGQQEGSIRKDLYVGLVKRFILGAVDEVINTWLHSDKNYDLVSMADPLVDLFVRGIGTSDNKK